MVFVHISGGFSRALARVFDLTLEAAVLAVLRILVNDTAVKHVNWFLHVQIAGGSRF